MGQIKNIEAEKEKKAKMPTKEEKSPEKKVKEKSSYKKLISNLQTTYPDLSQEEALKGILALRVENNGTLTGMTMLEIMERVIQLARPYKSKPQESKKGSDEENDIGKSKTKNKSEEDYTTNGHNATSSKGDISKTQNKETEEKYGSTNEREETQNKKVSKDEEDAVTDDEEETPRRRRENLINKKAMEQRRKKKEMESEREPSLESVDDLLLSEKGEESDAQYQPDLSRKSPGRKKKISPKKKDQEHSDSEVEDEESETQRKPGRKRKENLETTRTPSRSRGRKTMVEKEEDQADESDASFNPDPTLKTPKRKSSSLKREESALDAESENEAQVKSTKKSSKKSKKPANNDEMVASMLEELEEAPRSARKRKIPSYLREFAVEDTKVLPEKDTVEDEPVPQTPKNKSVKRRRIEDDPEPETPKRRKVDEEFKTPKSKKNNSVRESSHKKTVKHNILTRGCKQIHNGDKLWGEVQLFLTI